MDGYRNLSRYEIRGLFQSCLNEVETWVAQAERRLSQLYPHGAQVEVRLRRGQHRWTPAKVFSSGVNAYGANTFASVTVELPTHRGARKYRFRTVDLDSIRLINPEN